MKRIAIISDTHGPLPNDVLPYIDDRDELWHAGDLGSRFSIEDLPGHLVFRGVYGNIDDRQMRYENPLDLNFECEGLRIFMTHIGGYPGRYTKRVRELLETIKPDVYICGHSHICKIMKDNKRQIIHINPGACGHIGFHKIRTMVLLDVEHKKITSLKVVELGTRGRIS